MHFVLKLSKLCDLRCTYCYEYDELARKERMPLEGLEFFIEGVAQFALEQRARSRGPSEFRFVFHGGEPLLLPDAYLSSLCDLQHKILDPHQISYWNIVQTNLFGVTRSKLELLHRLGIRLGVSFDVFGGQRLTLRGTDSQNRVLDNLQMLSDIGYVDDSGVGAISVLHRGNIDYAEQTYDFFNELRISYRILPLDAAGAATAPSRYEDLVVSNEAKVNVFKRIAERHARLNKGIRVLPLDDYLRSARRYLADTSASAYNFPENEWALIVNTNGDAYNSGDAYVPRGFIGNVFRQTLSKIFESDAYAATVAMRRGRMLTCEACRYRNACPRIPIAEMYASEREFDADGRLICAVAAPMIADYVQRLRTEPVGLLWQDTRAGVAAAVSAIEG